MYSEHKVRFLRKYLKNRVNLARVNINREVANFYDFFSKIIENSRIFTAESYRIDLQINQYKCIWPNRVGGK